MLPSEATRLEDVVCSRLFLVNVPGVKTRESRRAPRSIGPGLDLVDVAVNIATLQQEGRFLMRLAYTALGVCLNRVRDQCLWFRRVAFRQVRVDDGSISLGAVQAVGCVRHVDK
jgi:hypothetical protein